jgi:hypothetical protein
MGLRHLAHIVLGASILVPYGAVQAQPKFTTLYNFSGGSDGALPVGTLVFDQDGAKRLPVRSPRAEYAPLGKSGQGLRSRVLGSLEPNIGQGGSHEAGVGCNALF